MTFPLHMTTVYFRTQITAKTPGLGCGGALLALSLVIGSQPGRAETAASEADTESSSRLEEITVTATRRSESTERIPISINALTKSDLAGQGITDIAGIAALTPGLQFDVPNGYSSLITTISIRGMNTQVGADVVGLYLDDTPLQNRLPATGNVGPSFPSVFDMSRVEVLRGPQGTLFGAGSEAGAVRFITNQPSLNQFSGSTTAEFDMTQDGGPSYELGAAAGGPIIDGKLGFRVSAWTREDGGYINRFDPVTGQTVAHDANTARKISLKAALAFQAFDDTLVTPSVFYQANDSNDSGRFFTAYSNVSAGILNNGTLLPEVARDHFIVPSIKIESHLSFADLTAVASYTNRDAHSLSDGSVFYGGFLGGFGSPLGVSNPISSADVSPIIVQHTLNSFTEEVRLASNQPQASFTWVAGIYNDHRAQRDLQYSWTNAFNPTIQPTGAFDPANFPSYYINEITFDDQFAIFGQADLHLTDKLTLTLGERVAKVKTHERDYNGTGLLNIGEPPVAFTSINETPNTPRVAVSFQADRTDLFYAAIAKGFRVGGGNAPIPASCGEVAAPYKSDYAWSYELGAKNQFFNGQAQTDTSVFYVKWSRIQQVVIPPCGTAFATNTGDAVSKGFDFALQQIITDQLRVNLNVGYVNAYFVNNYFISPGVPLVLKGDKVGFLPQVNPPWNANLSPNYEIPLAAGAKINLRATYLYNSRNSGPFITQIKNSPNFYNLINADPPTHMFNLRAAYIKNKFDGTVFVNNVFNSQPLLGTFQFPVQSNLATNRTLRPRTVGVSINFAF